MKSLMPPESRLNYDLAPCYMFCFSHSGQLVAMNETMLRDLEFAHEEVVGKVSYNDILTVGSRIFFQTHFYPLIRMQGAFSEIFLSFRSKSGHEIPVLMNVVMNGTSEDHFIHCAGIKIVQRNRYEKEILEARRVAEKALTENEILNRLRGELEEHQHALEKKLRKITAASREQKQLSSVISHDLQEPLRKIMTFVNILKSEESLEREPNVADSVEKIAVATRRMRYLVLSMQKYLTLNEKNFKPASISLKSVFNEAVSNVKELLSEIPVQFEVGDLPAAEVDGPMMVTLFEELLSNSIKFRSARPELLIRIETDRVEKNIFEELERYQYREFFRIRYSDNGIGFDERFNEEVFSLFRKANIHSDGLGFGLAYCKKVVHLHNGSIKARPKAGQGTEFTILLPLDPEMVSGISRN